MITTVLNNGLTQLEAESGKWLTENFPTMFRRFLKKLVLSAGQTAESWRDAEDEEKQSFTPPRTEKDEGRKGRLCTRPPGRSNSTTQPVITNATDTRT